jgi:hypothetical protein
MPADMGIKPERLEQIEAFYAGRKGKDTFVDYEMKVYKGNLCSFFCLPVARWTDQINSRLW